jgi:hypothetical protein
LTYHDHLCIYNALTREGVRLMALWYDSLCEPALRDKAAEYSADLNQNNYLKCKVERLLKAERNRQLAAERAEQAAALKSDLTSSNHMV